MSILVRNMEMPKSCSDCFAEQCIGSDFGCGIIGFEDGNTTCFTKERRKDCPLIEVSEQKHGKWIWNSNNGFSYCSCCDAVSPHEDQYGEYCDKPNFCPNCGAQMDGDSDV